ncbi:CDP-diacylglycerol--glycerol-3-phosphate 3-phosphatidyltransferase [Olsenella uli]|uniref:CDP-diacylglycerol--glycerol-3-phosphate 3-phosphatidyltransferase n=1 Tax=Olsenella uli TaxID=133926 RepID=UPI00195792B1|nr:CDP-diacylglycerol--glycerol-3-phosphate 3-phosphatidyltransferase [Olsenella uli]MBM6817000.1 CDP-diacylglycerol--glycerol-3-phosphate 3-phosphatidyltransferase [Olsenella uli]
MAGEKGIWTPANVVTCVRIALIPVFMVVAAAAEIRGEAPLAVAAFVIYATLSLTDKVDGHLARSRNEITDFGKFLDPIADKLLVFSALLLLLEQGWVSVWAVFVILLREFLVSALRMVAASSGEVIAADSLGKAKTAVTMVALCGFYLAFALLSLGALDLGATVLLVARALFAAAVVLTVVSGAQYFWGARHVVFGRGA